MGAAKERSDNMKAMGIEETKTEKPNEKKEEKKEEPPLVFDPITVDSLRLEKGFQKTAKKQQKELDALRKKQTKERLLIQKTHNSSLEKCLKGKR